MIKDTTGGSRPPYAKDPTEVTNCYDGSCFSVWGNGKGRGVSWFAYLGKDSGHGIPDDFLGAGLPSANGGRDTNPRDIDVYEQEKLRETRKLHYGEER